MTDLGSRSSACFRVLAGQSEADREDRTLTQLAGDVEPPAMSVDDVLDDRQTQSGTSHRAGARRIDAVEALGETRQMFATNALAVIAHRDGDERWPGGPAIDPRRYFDRRALVTVFDSVVEKVLEHLRQLVRLAHNLRQVLW